MSFVTKTHLSRRTFLHGAGVTLALPFLESMVPALARRAGVESRPAAHPPGLHLLSARRHHAEVDAGDRRRGTSS